MNIFIFFLFFLFFSRYLIIRLIVTIVFLIILWIPIISMILIMTGELCASISKHAYRPLRCTESIWPCRIVGSRKAGQDMSRYDDIGLNLNKVWYSRPFDD